MTEQQSYITDPTARLPEEHAKMFARAMIDGLEQEPTPSARLENVIERFERGWVARGNSDSRSTRMWGDCNLGPDILGYVLNDQSQRDGFDAVSKKVQLLDLHSLASGNRYPEAFQHGFNLLTIDGEKFLADVTFGQFLGEDGTLQWAGSPNFSSGVSNDNPLAVQLVEDGYVPLTNENLYEYLRITSQEKDRSYVKNINVEMLDQVRELPEEIIESDGINPDFGMSFEQ